MNAIMAQTILVLGVYLNPGIGLAWQAEYAEWCIVRHFDESLQRETPFCDGCQHQGQHCLETWQAGRRCWALLLGLGVWGVVCCDAVYDVQVGPQGRTVRISSQARANMTVRPQVLGIGLREEQVVGRDFACQGGPGFLGGANKGNLRSEGDVAYMETTTKGAG